MWGCASFAQTQALFIMCEAAFWFFEVIELPAIRGGKSIMAHFNTNKCSLVVNIYWEKSGTFLGHRCSQLTQKFFLSRDAVQSQACTGSGDFERGDKAECDPLLPLSAWISTCQIHTVQTQPAGICSEQVRLDPCTVHPDHQLCQRCGGIQVQS